MGLALFVFTGSLLLLLRPLSCSAASGRPMCREEDLSVLLRFKNSFFNETYCSNPWKIMSWKAEEGKVGDCCDWGGVTCDEEDGHVIRLDLVDTCLVGWIDSESGIFDLIHLQDLNLAYNSFSQSPLPSAIGRLTRLTRLNLSSSGFVGEVVPEMMRLSNLSLLDLSGNEGMNISSLEELLRSLNKIEELHLSSLTILDGNVPRSLGNMTSLRSLDLFDCGLFGEFPDSIFALPRLEFLDIRFNKGLTGRLAGFHQGSPIKSLKLSWTSFTGELPVWLGNLSSLAEIDISYCGFWGEIPASIGDLTKLEYLGLAINKFHGPIPPTLENLTSLAGLDLSHNRLSGEIPWSLGNLILLDQLVLNSNQLTGRIPAPLMQLSKLTYLDLSSNMLTGRVPSWISNLTRISFLDLSSNKFHGPLPHSIYGLQSLTLLYLGSNHLNGVASLDLLLKLKGLAYIDLSSNVFSTIIIPEPNVSVSQIVALFLDSSNLTEVPQFLKGQHQLKWLSLSNNIISGHIPKWLLQITLWDLDISFNYMEGTLPIPSDSIKFYLISNNKLSREIPSAICELQNLRALDLANNDFTGVLPSCFGNFSSNLDTLSLMGNNFSGKIFEFNNEQCEVTTLELSSNLFEGPLPRSLVNCPMLTYVDFGRNRIRDTFPSWLGSLPSLKVLMLHSNRFHGLMKAPKNNSWFPRLKVIYMPMNNLHGPLPARFFVHLSAMRYPSPDDDEYPRDIMKEIAMKISDKGIEREFGRTYGSFTLLDLSCNNFSGTIPDSIGDNLLKLRSLNFSNNYLSGQIPLSLTNLRNLEVLDLSRNRLCGAIPGMLAQITTLNHFNVSYNNLSGLIPEGNQFGTFENTSYIGNTELCGSPLTRKCGNPPTPAHNQEEKSSLPLGIVWISALAGLAGGLVVGMALEQAFGADIVCCLAAKWRKYSKSTA